MAGRGIKAPNEDGEIPKYRTVVNFIFGGNRERMLEITFGNQKVDVYRSASDKWGEENIVAFIVHLDETNPHIHMTLLPIDKDKKSVFKK